MTEPPETFPFDRLLPEIQLLVWEAALPPRRIFHVRETYTNKPPSSSPFSSSSPSGGFRFHIRHPPPALLAVCRTARDAALRRGIFLDGPHGAWFSPATDMLYFDRNQRHSLRPIRKLPHHTTAAEMENQQQQRRRQRHWAAIRHVGLEWRAFFAQTPRLRRPGEDAMGGIWREALAALRARMPALRTVTYVLPMVRHAGGLAWGREPYGAQRFEAELVRLPDKTNVPWGDSLRLDAVGAGGGAGQRAMAELMDGRKNLLVPWGDIRRLLTRR